MRVTTIEAVAFQIPPGPGSLGNRGREPHVADTNGGLHFGGVLLISPGARLHAEQVEAHFNGNPLYTGPGLSLAWVYVEQITETPAKAAAYRFKSLTRRRCLPEDLIWLPRDHSEMPRRSWLSRRSAKPGKIPNHLGISDEPAR